MGMGHIFPVNLLLTYNCSFSRRIIWLEVGTTNNEGTKVHNPRRYIII